MTCNLRIDTLLQVPTQMLKTRGVAMKLATQ